MFWPIIARILWALSCKPTAQPIRGSVYSKIYRSSESRKPEEREKGCKTMNREGGDGRQGHWIVSQTKFTLTLVHICFSRTYSTFSWKNNIQSPLSTKIETSILSTDRFPEWRHKSYCLSLPNPVSGVLSRTLETRLQCSFGPGYTEQYCAQLLNCIVYPSLKLLPTILYCRSRI